jgi:hypothetical protein
VALHGLEAVHESKPLTWHRQADPVHAVPPREDPTYGWRWCGVMEVVRHGRTELGALLSKSAWRHGVDPSCQGHPHAPPFNPVGCVDQPRRDAHQRVLTQPNAPVNGSLPWVGDEDRGLAERAGGTIGAQDIADLGLLVLRTRCVIRLDLGLALPRDGRERRAWGGPAVASVALVCSQRRGLKAVLQPARGHRGAGSVCGCGGANAWGWQGQERRGDGLVGALGGVVACRVGTFKRCR